MTSASHQNAAALTSARAFMLEIRPVDEAAIVNSAAGCPASQIAIDEGRRSAGQL
jgi:hypothetical protein